MNNNEKEILKIYLEEVKKVASTKRIGKVLVSPQSALDNIVLIIDELYNELKI